MNHFAEVRPLVSQSMESMKAVLMPALGTPQARETVQSSYRELGSVIGFQMAELFKLCMVDLQLEGMSPEDAAEQARRNLIGSLSKHIDRIYAEKVNTREREHS